LKTGVGLESARNWKERNAEANLEKPVILYIFSAVVLRIFILLLPTTAQ
jgi:hypothetical protein